MSSVNISISHDYQLVITRLVDIKVFSNTGSHGGNDSLDLFIGKQLVDAGFLRINDLAAQGKYGLKTPVPTLFGRTTGRITFNNK